MNKHVASALELANQRMRKKHMQNRHRLKQASGNYVGYDLGYRDDIVIVDRDVWNEIMQAFTETSTNDQTGGFNMDKRFNRLFEEIDEIKKVVNETNDKVSAIDKNVAVLEERSKHMATKAYVLTTGVVTVVTILASIFGFANFFK